MVTTKRLELIFLNASGSRVTIGLWDPKENLTGAEVEAAMNTIVQKNVFDSPGGDLVAIQGARLVTREVSEIELLS